MAAREILRYPHPLLRRADNHPLHQNDPSLAEAVRDLIDTLEASPGVGLAAPQVGLSVQLIVVDVSRDAREDRRAGHGRIILLNPRLLEASAPRIVREGCLSVPDFTGNVPRFERVVVEGITPAGRYIVIESTGYEAVAFQHEIDHVEGRLFLDRLLSPRRDLFLRRKPG